MGRRVGLAAAWLAAVVTAVAVGLVAVSSVGASVRGRGALGNEVIRTDDLTSTPTPDPAAQAVTKDVSGGYGRFVVRCQGVYATGVRAVPAPGWRVVSYEPGPDDDVDAVFSNGRRSVDLEIFCNRGVPTVAEIERNTLPEEDR